MKINNLWYGIIAKCAVSCHSDPKAKPKGRNLDADEILRSVVGLPQNDKNAILQQSRHRKRYIVFLFCLLVILANGCGRREIANIGSKGGNIICFGDSITFGYGADPQESYPIVLSKILGLPVINAGIDGDTSSEGLERLNSDVLSKNPLLVIIEFGGNDFLKKVPLEQTADNIRKMIDSIHEKGAMVAVVDISAGLLLRDYRPLLYKISREKKVIFIPSILSGIITNPSMKSDFLHPNSQGYKIIAQKIYKKISISLKENEILRNAKN